MNPHQKPQKDVVGLTHEQREAIVKKAADRIVGLFSFDTLHGVENLHARLCMCAREAAEEGANAVADAAYEAGRRDMREAAGRFLQERLDNYRGLMDSCVDAGTDENGYALAVEALQRVLEALPTEPLGGEG